MNNEHPITPPPELVHQWAGYAKGYDIPGTVIEYIAAQAARWGADIELEACCEWLFENIGASSRGELYTERRPKPPSLREQALKEWAIIRRALESLPD